MFYLVLSILFTMLLLVNFRLHPKYQIDTTQAIVFNYWVCVILGWFLMPSGATFSVDWSADVTYFALLLGVGFIVHAQLRRPHESCGDCADTLARACCA